MINNKNFFILVIIFTIFLTSCSPDKKRGKKGDYSIIFPPGEEQDEPKNDSPEGFKPEIQPNLKKVRTTTYSTAYLGDYEAWYREGDDDLRFCIFPRRERSFYQAVKCQGSGITTKDESGTDRICSAFSIGKIQGQGCKIRPDNIRGTTKTGTNPTAKRTIAVDPEVIPLDSIVFIYWKKGFEWNGCFVAEDTGGGIDGKHIDIYTGVGIDSELEANIPDYAEELWYAKNNSLQEKEILTYCRKNVDKYS